jgi:MoaA/NifB/PqqE/SkfB family radical SAM enzyme
MANPIRQAGRWAKRSRLRLMRAVGSDKRYWNTALNLRELYHGRTRLASYPRQVQVGSTMACNLRCFFCMRTVELVQARHDELRGRLEREMPPGVFEQVLGLMPYAETFDLTPFGENFLFSQFGRILDEHERLACRNLTMTTAGTLITPEWAERIVRAAVQQVKISIEESEEDRYAAMRVGARLEQVVEGIRLLNEWKERIGSRVPRLTLAASFMQRNIERLPAMVRFAAAQNVREIYVQMLELKYSDDPDVRAEELTHHVPLLRRMIAEGEVEAKRHGVIYVVTPPILNLLQSGEKPTATAAGHSTTTRHRPLIEKCTNPWWWAYVDESGRLWPCCWAKVTFGSLEEQSFMDVWNSDVAQEMRRRFLDDDIPNYCRGQLCHVDYD